MQAACAEMQSTDCPCFYQCRWAHGVVVSHPLRMRKALGSNPSVSICYSLNAFGEAWHHLFVPSQHESFVMVHIGKIGLLRELNPGPLAPEARIMPLDQAASWQRHSQAISGSLMLSHLGSAVEATHDREAWLEATHGRASSLGTGCLCMYVRICTYTMHM